MSQQSKIKCAWCGQILAITNKGRPRQHINGRTTCVGSAQKVVAHERLHEATASNKPK